MTDIYMNGAEVHAETPEEEREASLILNAALSGKTSLADGCICPAQRDSTVGKGFSMRFCDGTDMTVTPTLDVEGNPEMEICCNMGDVVEETAEEPTYYYEVTLEPKPVLRSYIAAAYDLCNELTDSELEQMGHDRKTGRIRLLHALETVDALADYSEEAATEEFGNYMDANFPNVTFKPEFVNIWTTSGFFDESIRRTFMMDNKTCSVDILGVSLGEEGYLIIPRQTRELCEPLVKAADALERALGDLPVDEADQNRIARLSAELMAQAEQYAVELGIQAYLEFTRTLSPEMNAELEGHKDNGVPET